MKTGTGLNKRKGILYELRTNKCLYLMALPVVLY